MNKLVVCAMMTIAGLQKGFAQDHSFDPPWNTPPQSKVMFTIPGVDNVPDLFGDINNPQLVIFFAGNQFMCIDDLLSAFKEQFPQYQRIFAETLPPGILAKQIEGGSITIGNMRISLQPDIYTAGKSRITQLFNYFADTATYAYNSLAIMVAKGNPKNIHGLKDLGRSDVRVSMPDPATEEVAGPIQQCYVKAGGDALKRTIMGDKVKDSSTRLTQIHHRQTAMRIMYGYSDAGPVWLSESYYQELVHNPVETVQIPANENTTASYIAGRMKNAPHQQAAKDFMQFLQSPASKAIYRKYGFTAQ